MASLEDHQKKAERELKLAKLECDFYRTCSAVRCSGIELETLRGTFLQELVEIEEKKNMDLTEEIKRLQVGNTKRSCTILFMVGFIWIRYVGKMIRGKYYS